MDDAGHRRDGAQKRQKGPRDAGEKWPRWADELLISALINVVDELSTKLRTRRAHRKAKSEKSPE